MPTISSRTPEGKPNFCSICGRASEMETSPETHDATCPSCGSLLWYEATSIEVGGKGRLQRNYDVFNADRLALAALPQPDITNLREFLERVTKLVNSLGAALWSVAPGEPSQLLFHLAMPRQRIMPATAQRRHEHLLAWISLAGKPVMVPPDDEGGAHNGNATNCEMLVIPIRREGSLTLVLEVFVDRRLSAEIHRTQLDVLLRFCDAPIDPSSTANSAPVPAKQQHPDLDPPIALPEEPESWSLWQWIATKLRPLIEA